VPRFGELALKTAVVHTVTYFIVGALAYWLLDYAEVHARMSSLMRQTTDPMVMAGPLFQPLRGLVFALALYPIRESVFHRRNGWLVLWWLFVALGILSTFGPTPGSLEGLVYTVIPVSRQLLGLIEVLLQSCLLALVLVYWVEHPEKRWVTRVMLALFSLVIALPILGLVTTPRP